MLMLSWQSQISTQNSLLARQIKMPLQIGFKIELGLNIRYISICGFT